MKTLIWLDDSRDPFDSEIDWLVFSPIGRHVGVIWIPSYDQFVSWILIHGLPDGICFDHDLGTELTGYDCAKWLCLYCEMHNLQLPPYNIQSGNSVGKENIDKYLQNYKKHMQWQI